MKLLWITNLPAPYRVDFFNELGKQVDLTVLYERRSADDREDTWFSNTTRNYKEIYLDGMKFKKEQTFSVSVIKFLNHDDYDIYILGLYSTPTQILANFYLRFKKKIILISSDGGFIKKDNFLTHIIKTKLISGANYWLSTGRETTKYLIQYGAKEKNIYKYPFTSIKEEDIRDKIDGLKKQQIKKMLGVKEENVVLSIGQFIPRKGFDILIKAFSNMPYNTALYIVGGKETQEYINLKRECKNQNIYFREFLNKEELLNYYQISDLFVLPTREDIWGLVINEAMANSLPIITTDKCISGLELIKGNGYITEVEDYDSLYKYMKSIIENDWLQKEMGMKSKEIIKEYTIENMVKRHIELFEDIMNKIEG